MARRRLWFVTGIAVLLIGGAVFVYRSLNTEKTETPDSSLIGDQYEIPSIGFEQVEANYDWNFPEDYGAHPTFQREEWMLSTSNDCSHHLIANFSLLNIVPPILPVDRESEWAVESIMTAQLMIRDEDSVIVDKVADSRVALNLAGANGDRVWIENWELNWVDGTLTVVGIEDTLNITLVLEEPSVDPVDGWYQYTRPVTLNGSFSFAEEDATISCEAVLTHRFGTP